MASAKRTKTSKAGSAPKAGAAGGPGADDRLYTLEVELVQGPFTDAFLKKNPVVSRTIEIRGRQTLEDLHEAIFRAFDRDDEHLYEFQLRKRSREPHSSFGSPEWAHDSGEVEDASEASMDSLKLRAGRVFGYRFDLGDEWIHDIRVVSVGVPAARTRYPRVTVRTGQSPPQYPNAE